jgi:hypothetical protein
MKAVHRPGQTPRGRPPDDGLTPRPTRRICQNDLYGRSFGCLTRTVGQCITAGRRAVIWPLAGPLSSPGIAHLVVACSVYLYIATLGTNVRFCRISRVWVGRSGWRPSWCCGRSCAGEGVGVAQGVGHPVLAGHAADPLGRVCCGHPGRGDEQRACRGSVHDRHRVGRGAEPGLGHPDHWDGKGCGLLTLDGMSGMRAEDRPALWWSQGSAAGGGDGRDHGR